MRPYSFSFTTLDTTSPAITSTNPVNNASGVPANTGITVNFSENVIQGPGYNNITLTDDQNNPVSVTKNVSDQTLTISPVNNLRTGAPISGTITATFDCALQSSSSVQIILSAGGTSKTFYGTASGNQLTVGYVGLVYGTNYMVTIPAGSIYSTNGASNDAITWTFTTQANP
ncbi:MAG: hypothetical protein A4E52_01860 [Pelotomaculum sp. PtaB.Bin013]|uniref:Ig-like domain-containing protein n=1 Tax=Pelotomaculum isophthalicicum JI TaxID=947010 RepID=A0A9X4JSQ6_9FIRM|nr:Ig-like domain-containing protein [Pelotomaculum isophthalicicum]MDF9407119.1 Ig-like domain-containing protein [Pelotomaculum isophthalicicum JI]OPX83308.1 MAG: hypothetical protein A4E52_01860 [Pelotomaculum sp. PtaB.Bin013]